MPLDRNESYWMLDEELVELTRTVGGRELSTYPDPQYHDLKKAIAQYAGVAPDQIFVTPGSASAIEHITRLYANSTGVVALPVPTFYGYETILGYVGTQVLPITYEEHDGRFIFPLEKVVATLKDGLVNVLFICQPNNPLGCSLSRGDISKIVEAAHNSKTMLVSDEAYFEFSSGTSFLPYLSTLPNLIVIRSLSKSFGLSGARVGWAMATQDIVKKLDQIQVQWPIAHPSTSIACTLLSQAEKIKFRRDIVIRAREQFADKLSKLPNVKVYPSETNFILVRVLNALHVQNVLLEKGIRIASGETMSRFSEAKNLLRDTLRIVVPAPESEALFMDTFQNAMN